MHARDIHSGDFIFLKARVIGCDSVKRTIDYSQVSETGEVEFLDSLRLGTAGETPATIREKVADEIGERQKQRPQSIEIELVDATDTRTLVHRLRELVRFRQHGCEGGIMPPLPEDRERWDELRQHLEEERRKEDIDRRDHVVVSDLNLA